jgi:YHS domain-containing protein
MYKTTFKTFLAGSILAASSLSFAADVDMNADVNDLAIQGYDPVSYFSGSQPSIGNANYTTTYKGGIYRFSSEENRDTFNANPAKYAPQYGGFCAFGVSVEKKFDTDPLAWKIVDNKLYLNLNKSVQKKWLTDVSGYLNTANEKWPDIQNIEAKKL